MEKVKIFILEICFLWQKNRKLKPKAIIMDGWHLSLKNLKAIRSHEWNWITTLRKNRKINHNESLNNINISDDGTKIHLRGYGWITVFKFAAKNGRIDYIATNLKNPTKNNIQLLYKARWSIEVYHRELKQTCGIECCQARTGRAQRNHIYLSILAWVKKQQRRFLSKISFYRENWNVIKLSIKNKISIIMNSL